jgi:hypothetical protein
MKFKAVIILLIIIFSLIPAYMMYKYLQKVMRPKESMRLFFLWLLTNFILIFVYTFLIVFLIRLLFPGA